MSTPATKSLIRSRAPPATLSDSAWNTNVSPPAPPVMTSRPAPPVIVSSPPRPTITLSTPLPVRMRPASDLAWSRSKSAPSEWSTVV